MKKILIAGAFAAAMLPAAAFAQTSNTMTPAAGATGTMEAAPGGAMGAGAASPTSDLTGSYTIVTKTQGEQQGTTTGADANRNTDSASIQRTIDANPGLAEKLQAEGVMLDEIGSISVEPNGQVVVFNKS